MQPASPVELVTALHGQFYVLRNDTFISRSMSLYGEWTESEFELLAPLLRAGDHAIDVGANIGCMSVPMARAVGPAGSVLAFEPQPGIFRLLAGNTLLNGLHNVRLFHAVCGAVSGELALAELDFSTPENYGAFSLGHLANGAAIKTSRRVAVVRLDDVVDVPALRLIKIDVEGMEGEVVRGAAGIIRQHRPFLYVENEMPGANSVAAIEAILALDYQIFWHFAAIFNPANFRGNASTAFATIACVNMLCTPLEVPVTCPLRRLASVTEHPRSGEW